jgi:4-alpha-glucanotransferase
LDELTALHALARAVGVHPTYVDGLLRPQAPSPDTLVRVCAAVGAPISAPSEAIDALRAVEAWHEGEWLPPVAVAWDGWLPTLPLPGDAFDPRIELETGEVQPVAFGDAGLRLDAPLPFGYHTLAIERHGITHRCRILAAPVRTFHRAGSHRSWGVGTQLAALRSRRSRSVGDLVDLAAVCDWVGARGGDLVTVLPLLPTFNDSPAEPSPYSPVSRLFWSELMLDLGSAHVPVTLTGGLDVGRAQHEVVTALAGRPVPAEALADPELRRYARFRGAQARLGRNWRAWPPAARGGELREEHIDSAVEHFHLVAEIEARHQLGAMRRRLDAQGMRLGLDLAVGVHPDGYDTWSRQALFAGGMSVGAPPDLGFPSGQDWGFSPVLPNASRAEGHAYLAASIGHQMRLAGVLRIDHVMAFSRLYWIPHGMGLDEGTYVSYPAEELFAILSLESNRHRSEVVGENLGTVPKEIFEALPRHGIAGMYVAQFQAGEPEPEVLPPGAADMALVGTHDTPTFAGWITGDDITDRVAHGLLAPEREDAVRTARAAAVARLAAHLGADPADRRAFLGAVLAWLGATPSPLVVAWFEDLWLEERGVNLPGTPSSSRPNWQRPMSRLLDDLLHDPEVAALADTLARARAGAAGDSPT